MSDEIMLTIGEDGKATLYDDTYDITIHCGSKEEYDKVMQILQNPKPHWIPCSERLPKKCNTAYLATMDYGKYGRAVGQRFFFDDNIGWNDKTVIAWMPLPEEYRGE